MNTKVIVALAIAANCAATPVFANGWEPGIHNASGFLVVGVLVFAMSFVLKLFTHLAGWLGVEDAGTIFGLYSKGSRDSTMFLLARVLRALGLILFTLGCVALVVAAAKQTL